MRLTALIFLAFCFGLGYWEFSVRMRLRKDPYGSDYSIDLPRVFVTPVFKTLKLLGSLGIVIVPLLYWGRGFPGALAGLAVYFVLGALIGIAIPAIVDRM
jgi:hypothetical protein